MPNLESIDLLGDIPPHWKIVPAWSLYRRVKRTGHENEELLSVYRDHGVIPKSSRDDNHNVESEDLSGYQLVKTGDLVMNKMKAWQGSIALSDHQGIVSPAYFVFQPLHNGHLKYFHYLLRSKQYISAYNRISKGVRIGQWDLDPAYFRTLPIPVPPLAEQKAIADFLDQRLGEIERLTDSQRRLETTLKARRKALIGHAVTKGLNPGVVLVETGYSWLGEVPEHWKLGTLKRFAETGAGSGFPIEYQGVSDEEIPFLKVNSLSKADPTGLISSREDSVSRDTARQLGAKIYSAGSIVMAKIGAALLLGRVRTIEFDSCIDNNMMAIFPKPEVFPRFLYYLLQLIPFPLIVNPGAVPSTSEGAVANLHMIMPPMSEQEEIANFLDAETRKIDQLMDRNSLMLQVLEERKLALVAAAVTGKIDVRGQN